MVPVHFGILNTWVQEGRVDVGMRLLRADWSKWKRVERILPEITPAESIPGMIEEFPDLDLGRHSSRNSKRRHIAGQSRSRCCGNLRYRARVNCGTLRAGCESQTGEIRANLFA